LWLWRCTALALFFRCLIPSTTGFRPDFSPSIPPLPNSSHMRQCLCTKSFCLHLGKAWNGSPLQVHWITSYSQLFLLIAYFKNGGTRFHYSLEKAKELLQSSNSFIIAGLMVSIYACTDKLMLKQMLGADAVGHYSLLLRRSVFHGPLFSLQSLTHFIRRLCRAFRKIACAMSGRTGSSTQLFFMYPCLYPQ
jgi:O-antigen/teichoic acid export membrane protein